MDTTNSPSPAHAQSLSSISTDVLAHIVTFLHQAQIESLICTFDRTMQAKLLAPHVIRSAFFDDVSYSPGHTSYSFSVMKNLEKLHLMQDMPLEASKLHHLLSFPYLTYLELDTVLDPDILSDDLQLQVPHTSTKMPNIGAIFSKSPLETLILGHQPYFKYSEKWVLPYHLLVALFIDKLPKKLQRFELSFSEEVEYLGMSNLAFSLFPPNLMTLSLTTYARYRGKGESYYPTGLSLLPESLTSLRITPPLCRPYEMISSNIKDPGPNGYPFPDKEWEPSGKALILPNLISLDLDQVSPVFFYQDFTFSSGLESLRIDGGSSIFPSSGNFIQALNSLPMSLTNLNLEFVAARHGNTDVWFDSLQHLIHLKNLRFITPQKISGPLFARIMTAFLKLEHLELSWSGRDPDFQDFSKLNVSLRTLKMPCATLNHGTFMMSMLHQNLRMISVRRADPSLLEKMMIQFPKLFVSVAIPVQWNSPVCRDQAEQINAMSLAEIFKEKYPRLEAPIAIQNSSAFALSNLYRSVNTIDLQDGFLENRERMRWIPMVGTSFSLVPLETDFLQSCTSLTSLKLYGIEISPSYYPLPDTLTELDLGVCLNSDLYNVPSNLKIWRAPYASFLGLRFLVLPPSLTILDMIHASFEPVLGRMSLPKNLTFLAFDPSARTSSAWTDSDLADLINRKPHLSTIRTMFPAKYTGELLPSKAETVESGIEATLALLRNPSPNRTIDMQLELEYP